MPKFSDMPRDAGGAAASFGHGSTTAVLPARAVQHTWFELTRARPWRSLALVPVDERANTFDLGMELAQMAAMDPRNRVLLINASGVPGEGVGGPPVRVGAPPPAAPGANFTGTPATLAPQGKFWILDCAGLNMDEAQVGMVEVPKQTEHLRTNTSPYSMIIVAAGALLSRPAMVSTARAVDTVAICVSLGKTSFGDARRTVELIGEQSVVGTIALRSRR